MKLLQVTNHFSHHQLPLARVLAGRLGPARFRFGVTEPMPPDRRALGWEGEASAEWILRPGEPASGGGPLREWFLEGDVVICGNRSLDLIANRLDRGKLTFYMSERWWKPPVGMGRLLHPRFARLAWRFRKLSRSPFFHHLAIGGSAAADMDRFAHFGERSWQWGYFTETTSRPVPPVAERGKTVLWAGRMLDWKRVDDLIRAFAAALAVHPDAFLDLVGDGPERPRLVRLAAKLLPGHAHRFHPPVAADAVPPLMASHRVYVLPSNANEGWGAVVNEAMTAGCAVVASRGAGAAQSLIRDGRSGLLFDPGDWRALSAALVRALADDELALALSREGRQSILVEWSPAEAATRLLAVAGALLERTPVPGFQSGPMARPGALSCRPHHPLEVGEAP